MSQNQPDGYLALPASGSGSPVLVLHAWWGLNDTIRTLCARLAEVGFVAFAPDLFQGKVADTIPGAEALVEEAFGRSDDISAAVARAAAFVTERADRADGLAVMGFSFGAWFALELSVTDPDRVRSVVVFYGARPTDDYDRSQAHYLGHFAEMDAYEAQEDIDDMEESLRRAGRPVTFHRYPDTSHWFFESDRTDAYNATAASLAWERTLAFLARPANS